MYFYEHTNGKIIRKTDAVVEPIGAERYFASPFVVKYWHEEGDKSEGLTETDQLKKAEKMMTRYNLKEEKQVRDLGDEIGYGRVMQLCESLWGDRLEEKGLPRGGAYSTGACVSQLVPCKHEVKDHNGHCEICCGSGRVTKWVSENVQKIAA